MIPLSLYIHLPWCVKKCPYCDFNSHTAPDQVPEMVYIDALLRDLEQDLPSVWGRKIQTIFIGGGTPSLFSPSALEHLLTQLHSRLAYCPTIETTLEANPGTVEQTKFEGYRRCGFNRLSIGIQSFQEAKLKRLGRIHGGEEAKNAVTTAKLAGFHNINIDLMFGLPEQTIEEAISDLQTAIELAPTHLSWYQLTIEPNTHFSQFPPTLPEDDYIWEMQKKGQELLSQAGYAQYEISAYSKKNFQCQHNRNYWEFGDYLGIGAGAHSKITDPATGNVQRQWKIKHPKHYLAATKFAAGEKWVQTDELPLEFMLNALRLYEPIPHSLFEMRTGLPITAIASSLQKAQDLGLLILGENDLSTTDRGKLYLNDLINCFM
jgi:oxygen-independent coproporphyrinogen-3 oxidase